MSFLCPIPRSCIICCFLSTLFPHRVPKTCIWKIRIANVYILYEIQEKSLSFANAKCSWTFMIWTILHHFVPLKHLYFQKNAGGVPELWATTVGFRNGSERKMFSKSRKQLRSSHGVASNAVFGLVLSGDRGNFTWKSGEAATESVTIQPLKTVVTGI